MHNGNDMWRPLRLAAGILALAHGPGAAWAQAPADSAGELPEVVVTAGPPDPLRPWAPTGVASADRVSTAPSRILPDILRELPGVQVQQTNAGHGTVILRGLTGNQVLVLVDGVRLNNATVRDGPNQYMALIDPERIQRVEVIRGPGSVRYGSDAMGGVVNVITRPPGRPGSGRASLSFASSDGGVRAHVDGSAGAGRLRARLGVTATSVGNLEAGGGIGEQSATGYRSMAADLRAALDAGGCHRVALDAQGMVLGDVSRYDRLVDFRAPARGPDSEFEFDPQTHLLVAAGYAGADCAGALPNRALSAGVQLQREGRRQRALEERDDGSAAPAPDRTYQRDDTRTAFVTGHVEPRLGAATVLRLGADLYADRVSSYGYEEDVASGARTPTFRTSGADTIPTGRFPDGATATTLGAYAQATRHVATRLRLVGGLRFDASRVRVRLGDEFGGDVEADPTSLTGQLGAAVALTPGVSLSGYAGQSFRAPNIYDFSTVSTVPGGIILPSADLGPERATTYEAVLRHDGSFGSASLAGYVTEIRDLLDRVPGEFRGDTMFDGRRVFRAANLGRGRVTGAEAAGAVVLGSALAVRAQAFWTRGTQRTESGSEPMTRIPPLGGSLALRRFLGFGAASGWAEFVVRAAGPQRRLSSRDQRDSRIQEGGTPGFVTLGLRAHAALGAVQLSAGLENLLDHGYRDHGSGIDSPGRHLWLRVEAAR